ncbi:MAG TPA: hypothetical protein VL122_10325 [Nitrospirota bacterium]|nr:hypothetical protein [Nitrospirota bacterium]
MRKIRLFLPCLVVLLATTVVACVPSMHLMPSAAEPAEIAGTYTLLLYGCRYPSDVKNAAFFVKEGSKYPLEIFDLDTSYKTIKGLTAQQALAKAEAFLRCSTYLVWQTQLSRIPDDSGGIIGYEMRPLYLAYQLGQADVLYISYFLKRGKVITYISLDRNIELDLESSGGSNRSDHGK